MSAAAADAADVAPDADVTDAAHCVLHMPVAEITCAAPELTTGIKATGCTPVAESTRYGFGAECQLSCDTGYTGGTATVKCEAQDVWNGQPPTCTGACLCSNKAVTSHATLGCAGSCPCVVPLSAACEAA